MRVADGVAEFIAELGISTIFALPGSSCLTTLDAVAERGISVVLGAEETATTHMATGYAAVSQAGVGCAFVSRGPGTVNALCGVASACDGDPVLLIAGDNPRALRGKGFVNQDLPIAAAAAALVPTFVLEEASQLWASLESIRRLLIGERRSCVLILPSDVQLEAVDREVQELFRAGVASDLASQVQEFELDSIQFDAPGTFVVWGRDAGRDVLIRAAVERLIARLPALQSSVTMRGLSYIPAGALGILGTQGHEAVNAAATSASRLVIVGEDLRAEAVGDPQAFSAGFDEIISISWGQTTRPPQWLHPTQEILTDRDAVVSWLESQAEPEATDGRSVQIGEAWLEPIAALLKRTDERTVVTLDSGQNFFWAADALARSGPRAVVYSDLQGTMGFALPAAIGAVAAGARSAVAVLGDGGLLMSLGELATIQRSGLSVTILVIDNAGLGMVRQTQVSRGLAHTATDLSALDIRTLAEAFGLAYEKIDVSAADIDMASTRSRILHLEVPSDLMLRNRGGIAGRLPGVETVLA